MRGELGAVEVTLRERGGVSVRSCVMRATDAIAGIGNGIDMA